MVRAESSSIIFPGGVKRYGRKSVANFRVSPKTTASNQRSKPRITWETFVVTFMFFINSVVTKFLLWNTRLTFCDIINRVDD